jgi:hypothetical protein
MKHHKTNIGVERLFSLPPSPGHKKFKVGGDEKGLYMYFVFA